MAKRGEKSDTPGKNRDQTRLLPASIQKPLILKKARFVVTRGQDRGKEIVLQKPLVTIGTLPENDLVLTDPTVSRHHAVVEEKADGYVLRDLNSTNGMFLEGARIREGYLVAGSAIRLGETDMIFPLWRNGSRPCKAPRTASVILSARHCPCARSSAYSNA